MLNNVCCLLFAISTLSGLFASEGSKKPSFSNFYFGCLLKNSALPIDEFLLAAQNNAQPITLQDWKIIQEKRKATTEGFGKESLSALYQADFSQEVPKQPYALYFLSTLATDPNITLKSLKKKLQEDCVAKETKADTKKITLIKEILIEQISPELFPKLYTAETLLSENFDRSLTPREPQWIPCKEHMCKCDRIHLVKNSRAPWLSQSTLTEYEKKDAKRLENLCKAAINHEELFFFIQEGLTNYVYHYGKPFDFHQITLDDTQRLDTYLKSKPELAQKFAVLKKAQNTYEACPNHKTSWLKRLFIGGTVVGLSCLWYRWYQNKTTQKILSLKDSTHSMHKRR